jgi:hypothetical protein
VKRSLTPVDLLLGVLLVAAVVLVFAHGGGHASHAILADPVRTPGVLNSDGTQANIRSTVCRRGWTATIRPPTDYTNDLKRKQMRLYGETGSLSDYQEDQPVVHVAGGVPMRCLAFVPRFGTPGDAWRTPLGVNGCATTLPQENRWFDPSRAHCGEAVREAGFRS